MNEGLKTSDLVIGLLIVKIGQWPTVHTYKMASKGMKTLYSIAIESFIE